MSAPHQDMLKSSPDPALLSLGDDELAFFKAQTGIDDIEQLRRHIIQVQAEAYEAYPYPCIRRFLFTKLRITQLPSYGHVLELGVGREAIFLDVGCCFGHDIRAVIADGYPLQNIVGLDLRRDLWDLGNKLFNSTPSTFPVPFVEGDIFDSITLDMTASPTSQPPLLRDLGNSLTTLRNHVSVIHISMVFHLFSEDKQLELAHRLAALLSPLPGSIIFGYHIGLATPGFHTNNVSGIRMFCHSPDSWRMLWDGVVFERGTIEADVELVASDAMGTRQSKSIAQESEFYGHDTNERWNALHYLNWSVKRV